MSGFVASAPLNHFIQTRSTMRGKIRPIVLVVAAIATALLVGLAPTASAKQEATFPTNPTALATDNGIFLDTLIALGFKPKCAVQTGGAWGPDVQPFSKGIQSLGPNLPSTTDFNDEALAACQPAGIIVGSSYAPGGSSANVGVLDQAIAPTLFITQPNPPLNSSGQVLSTWKDWVMEIANPMGKSELGRELIMRVDRRAAVVRGQVQGKTVATITVQASTFNLNNDYIPDTLVYEQDLGMKNLHLPASDYAANGAPGAWPPVPSVASGLSDEVFSQMNTADLILVGYGAQNGTRIQAFDGDPLFEALPAVKQGHWSQSSFFTNIGPLGVAYEYSAIETAFRIKEYFTTVSGGVGANASLTLNPATLKACWSLDPTPGKGRPSGAITMVAGAGSHHQSLTLAAKPRFYDPDPLYETSPPTYQTSGCTVVSSAFAKDWTHSPSSVRLHFAGGTGQLRHGAANIITPPSS